MLRQSERVWRHLLVAEERTGQRRHPNIHEIAEIVRVSPSTVRRSLVRPMSMDVVRRRVGGGVALLDPLRLALLWAGKRSLSSDVRYEARLGRAAVAVERDLPDGYILGGFGAVVAALKGNRIADYDRVICYGDPSDLPASLRNGPAGPTTLTVLEPDPLLASYGRLTPLCQAFVDLFNTPGWPAARFVETLLIDMARKGNGRPGPCRRGASVGVPAGQRAMS
jgi:hypothetical protein